MCSKFIPGLVCSMALFSAGVNAQGFNQQVDVGFETAETDSSDSQLSHVAYTYYFNELPATEGPLSLAELVSKASSFSVDYETEDENYDFSTGEMEVSATMLSLTYMSGDYGFVVEYIDGTYEFSDSGLSLFSDYKVNFDGLLVGGVAYLDSLTRVAVAYVWGEQDYEFGSSTSMNNLLDTDVDGVLFKFETLMDVGKGRSLFWNVNFEMSDLERQQSNATENNIYGLDVTYFLDRFTGLKVATQRQKITDEFSSVTNVERAEIYEFGIEHFLNSVAVVAATYQHEISDDADSRRYQLNFGYRF